MARIVVGVDGSQIADRALRWAVDEALLRDAEIELVLGYVVTVHRPPFTTPSRDVAERALDAIVERNADVLQRVTCKTTVVALLGPPYADAVIEAGEDADLIVVGSRGVGGFRELLLGATSYRVAAHAGVPVAVIRGQERQDADPHAGVVVGIDGSQGAVRALRWAVTEAALRGVDVTAVHGWFAPNDALLSGVASPEQIDTERAHIRGQAEAVLERAVSEVDAPDGTTVSSVLVAGPPAAAILDHADAAGLVVVGTRGLGGVRRAIVGSTSHQFLHHAPGPVVVVP